MDISTTPQHPRNKNWEFNLKYGKLKAAEKWNLQCKALDSLTKVIFALTVFNSSYFIIYFQKAFNTCVAIKFQTFARLKFVVIKRPKESNWGKKCQMPSISYYKVLQVRSKGSSMRCVQLWKELWVEHLLLLRSSTELLKLALSSILKTHILLERYLI